MGKANIYILLTYVIGSLYLMRGIEVETRVLGVKRQKISFDS